MIKCLAQGHKRRDRPGRDSNPHSDNTRAWVQCTIDHPCALYMCLHGVPWNFAVLSQSDQNRLSSQIIMGEYGFFCLHAEGQVRLTIRADFQQGMESVSSFKMNTVTENYWLILYSTNGNMTLSCGVYYFQSLRLSKTSILIPCPVDRDDIVPLRGNSVLLNLHVWSLVSTND